jgi:SPP1 family predicted phage head-tail adaptor
MLGKMDRHVTFQSLSETNTNGELVQTWTDIKTVWAYILEPRGNEAFESARINAIETIRIKIRYRDDINVKCRAVIDDKNYAITAIDRTERRDGYLWITAKLNGFL